MNRKNDTGSKIIDAARKLFSLNGPSRVKMGDVAFSAGISRKTLYQYHPNKEELLRAVIEATFKLYDQQINLILDDQRMAYDEKLSRLLTTMGEQLSWFSRPMVEDLRARYPAIWKRTEDFRNEKVMNNLEKLLEKGRAGDIYRKDIDARLLALMVFHMSQNIITPEVLAELSTGAYETFRSIVQVFMEGILH